MNDTVNTVEKDAVALWHHIEVFFEHLFAHTDPENKDALVGLQAQIHAVSGSEAPADPTVAASPAPESTDAAIEPVPEKAAE